MIINFRPVICAAGFCLLAACSTTAPTQDASMTAASATQIVPAGEAAWDVQTADAGEDDMICKRQPVAGSNFRRKICATQEQWDQAAEDGKGAAENIQRRNRGFEPSLEPS